MKKLKKNKVKNSKKTKNLKKLCFCKKKRNILNDRVQKKSKNVRKRKKDLPADQPNNS